jgi:hypothetical protein
MSHLVFLKIVIYRTIRHGIYSRVSITSRFLVEALQNQEDLMGVVMKKAEIKG